MAKPPQLPPDAPQDVKDFVDCKIDKVTLDPAKKGFLPDIPVIGAPNVTVQPVAGKPGTVKVSLTKAGGLLDTSFTITVTDGHLVADTADVSPQIVKDGIDRWLKRYNEWLDASKRRLAGITADKGIATVTKVPVGNGAGATAPPEKGGGIKKAVGVGLTVVVLAGGSYAGARTLGGDDEPNGNGAGSSQTSTPGPTSTASGGGVDVDSTPLDLTFTCDATAACGSTRNLVTLVAGVQITHEGSPAAADAPSDADIYGVTTWAGDLQFTARCPFGTTTGQATPGPDGRFEAHLPLYQFGHCDLTGFKLEDGTRFSDGTPVAALGVQGFDVTSTPTDIDDDTWARMADIIAALPDEAFVDAKVVVDRLVGADTCVLAVPHTDEDQQLAFANFCHLLTTTYPLQVEVPPADPGRPALPTGALQVTGLDAETLQRLFSDEGPFPCGNGDLGATICPAGGSGATGTARRAAPFDPDDGALVVQTVVPPDDEGPVVFDLGGTYQIGVALSAGSAVVDTTGGAEPYVIVRNQVVTVVVPDYTTSAIAVANGFAVAPWPVSPGAQQPDAVTRQEVQQFADDLAESLADPSDKTFALDHLDPAVLEVFPTQCPQHVRGIVDATYAIHVLRLAAPATYSYAPPSAGNTSVDVPDAVEVRVRITQQGQTRRAALHFGTADGLTWFTDCGS